MNSLCRIVSAALIALVTASCGHNAGNTTVFSHISVLGSGGIAIHALDGPDATVSADGNLSIDDKPVAVTPPQRVLLKAYIADAVALRKDAIATGAAGVATAGQAISSVVSGLSSGKPDQIGPEVAARAAKIETQVAKICVDLSALRKTQDALASQLAAFRPYATIDAEHDSCDRHRS
ncbi:MAG: hypothetical protein ABI082_13100 [Dokdonella sp.]